MATGEPLNRDMVERFLVAGQKEVLLDLDIITELRDRIKDNIKNLGKSFTSDFKKIILIKDDQGFHILSTKHLDSAHLWIARIYSIANGDSNVTIYGGGRIRMEIKDGVEKIAIFDESTSFDGMNLGEIKAVVAKLNLPIELDTRHMFPDKKGTEYTAQQLEYMDKK